MDVGGADQTCYGTLSCGIRVAKRHQTPVGTNIDISGAMTDIEQATQTFPSNFKVMDGILTEIFHDFLIKGCAGAGVVVDVSESYSPFSNYSSSFLFRRSTSYLECF